MNSVMISSSIHQGIHGQGPKYMKVNEAAGCKDYKKLHAFVVHVNPELYRKLQWGN